MKITFKNKKLEKSFTEVKEMTKTYGTMAKKVGQRYKELLAAENLWAISQLPVLRLHPHQGNEGIWSVDIQKNWRILFTIDQDPIPKKNDNSVDLKAIKIIRIESVEDPH